MTDKTKNMIGLAVLGLLLWRNISLMKQVKDLKEQIGVDDNLPNK
tara:strand:- start:788 stop:922 length:135 start_codon:yes stop_codon:yes gene_type:complete